MRASPGPIEIDWVDAWGRPRTVSQRSRAAVARAMGEDPEAAAGSNPVRIGHPGDALEAPALLMLEDGSDLGRLDRLPPDLPIGYHRLASEAGEQQLLVAPAQCHLPDALRTWGWSAQLATTRSERSWGIGDLDDLRALAAWSRKVGAGMLQVSPLMAPSPGPHPEASPYYPGTRRFRNVLHLSIGSLPGAETIRSGLAPLAAAAAKLNAERLVDRDRVLALKHEALELLWATGAGALPAVREGMVAFRASMGPSLRLWATYAAMTERLGSDWRRWPEACRDPEGTGVASVAAGLSDRIAFHEWVQWAIDEQLSAASSQGVGLLQDLPIGFDPGGFDAWSWQRELSPTASLGVPPDLLGPQGQDWGFRPFIPHRLRAAAYRPLVETLRAALRHAAGLRIDHILGFFRGWWVPDGSTPADGAYVRYPSAEMLAVLAIESVRAGAWVVGEDLGTLEAGVRATLAERRILSMRVLYFEEGPPAAYPYLAAAMVETHDLPTVAGVWSGADLDDQARAGIAPDPSAMGELRERLRAATGLRAGAPVRDVILGAHAALAAAPSALVTATLEDALAVPDRVNLPGTVETQRANWSLGLPRTIEQLQADPFVAALADELRRGRMLP